MVWENKTETRYPRLYNDWIVLEKGQCLSSYIKSHDLSSTLNEFVLQNVLCCWFSFFSMIDQTTQYICCFVQYDYKALPYKKTMSYINSYINKFSIWMCCHLAHYNTVIFYMKQVQHNIFYKYVMKFHCYFIFELMYVRHIIHFMPPEHFILISIY